MNRTLHNQPIHWKVATSLIFAAIVFLFWQFAYPAHLAYHEQFQLFLFDTDYLFDRIDEPGGVANYISDFFIQFYYHSWVGAIILAALFVCIQQLTWQVLRKQGVKEAYYPLSFLPIIAVWCYMCNENAMLSYPIALICTLLAMIAYLQLKIPRQRIVYVAIVLPLLYWIAGSVHFILTLWMVAYELRITLRNRYLFQGIAIAMTYSLLAFAWPLLSSIFVHYSIGRLMTGLEYYRFCRDFPLTWYVSLVITSLTPILMPLLPEIKKRTKGIIALQIALIVIGGGWYIKSGCDFGKEEAIRYDRLAFRCQWEEIIEQAEKKMPSTPQSVTCLNLALGMTGQLSDRMFEFYQNGPIGLIYPFSRNVVSSLCSSEVHYQLGMINAAQQITFEVMASTPNNLQNARCIRRLAETNLVNGQYEVAAKHLRTLQKTIYYKRWANHLMEFLYDETRINNHPIYGRLRLIAQKDDYLYSGNEMTDMLSTLFQQNQKNQLAFDYLMAHLLLTGDLQQVANTLPLIQHTNYKQIPRSYQEALTFAWAQNHTNFDSMPWNVSPNVKQAMTDFVKLYRTSTSNVQNLLKERYGKTYWYYITNRQQP